MTPIPVHLRPFREDDLALLERYAVDPEFSAPFEWHGFRWPESYRNRWEEDGFLGQDQRFLAVAVGDDPAIGLASWQDPPLFGKEGLVWQIGVFLAPDHRGAGAGTEAQRLLVEYLFETTQVHRISACTDADNVAEQRALEKCGFRREGLLKEAGYRAGKRRDAVVYGLLRYEAAPPGP